MITEIWKDIKGYYGLYKISNIGRVKSFIGHIKILKPRSYPSGHLYVNLYCRSVRKTHKLHRLVLENFIGPPPVGKECRHLDGNPKNNNLKNLKWDTRSMNHKDRKKHGTNPVGELHNRSKLKEAQVIIILQLLKQGRKQKNIARQFCVSPMAISDIKLNKKWKHIKRD